MSRAFRLLPATSKMKPYNPRGIYWPRESKRGPRFDARIESLRESGLSLSEIATLLQVEWDDDTISKDTVKSRAYRARKLEATA